MNTLILIIGLLLTATAVALVARGLIAARLRAVDTLGNIGRYGFRGVGALEPAAGLRGWFDDFFGSVGKLLLDQLRFGNEEHLRKQLVSAGMYRITPGKFVGYRLLATVGVPLIWLWFATSTGMSAVLTLLGAVFCALMGWWVPTQLVRDRAKRRLAEIDYELPELIDLLIVAVEAGLGFVGSLQAAAARLSGPLGQEISLALQEQSMGLSIQEVLLNMLGRVDTPSMRSFVRSVVQGETLGVSIGQIMRDLAQEMRRRRRAEAQERAQRAPIKLLFPLVILIFPAMFVVLLGPALFLFFRAFGHG